MSDVMGIHDGHRERLKQLFLENGLSAFNEINALEMLLFYAVPRKDTNVIAHELLSRFESIDRVFAADFEELIKVPGVGSNSATLIKLVPEIMKMSAMVASNNVVCMRVKEEFGRYLIPRFMNEQDEVFLMLCLNNKAELIKCVELGRGDVNSVSASSRKVAETALKYKAAAVVLAHNHPQGMAVPSSDDIMTTRKIKQALELVGVELSDHYVVAGDRITSMADRGYLTGIHNGFM